MAGGMSAAATGRGTTRATDRVVGTAAATGTMTDEPGAWGARPAEAAAAVGDVAYAGLDALRAVLTLDLCAYLHAGAAMGPQLYLRAPDLSAMDATAAFDLFSALRDALGAGEPGTHHLSVAGFEAVAVLTAGPASRGLFVVGRRGDPLDEAEVRCVGELCRAVGVAAHAVEAAARPAVEGGPLKVSVEIAEGTAHAEVVLPAPGGLRRGSGTGPSPAEAVARAALEALDPTCKLAAVTEGEVGGERLMAVLVRDALDRTAVGAALIAGDPLHATAEAAAEAAARLSGG